MFKAILFAVLSLSLSHASALHAAPIMTKKPSKKSSGGYRMLAVSTNLGVIGGELGVRLEANLAGEASLALEGIAIPEREEFSSKEIEEDNRSFLTSGYEVGASITRYSQPYKVGGFYWTLGAGYRQLKGVYRHGAAGKDYSFVRRAERDEEGRLMQDVKASGIAGRGRLGYRYVGESFPFIIGGSLGIRHFENKVEAESDSPDDQPSDDDARQLKRMLMTGFEGALELGIAF